MIEFHPLREWRFKHSCSLRELAKRTGLSIGALNQVELRHSSPSAATAQKIIEATGLSLQDILGKPGNVEAAE